MQNKKKWLAAMLTLAITLSDCGGITIFAEESVTAEESVGTSVSENDVAQPQNIEMIPSAPEENNNGEVVVESESDAPEETKATFLPALHMGQINKGDSLPSPDDPQLSYDLPLSFAASESLLLFTNYSIDTALETEDGIIRWSILRGEKDVTPGTATLLDEEDDWTGFETVTDAPWFLLSTDEAANDEPSPFATLTVNKNAIDSAVQTENDALAGQYCYYIRAAYYPSSAMQAEDAFYAAVTLPFEPLENPSEPPTPETADDTLSVSENNMADETTVSENTIDSADSETTDQTLSQETSVSENSTEEITEQDQVAEEDSLKQPLEASVSENSVTMQSEDSSIALTDESQQPKINDSVGVLNLDAEHITLHPTPAKDSNFSVTATLEPKDLDYSAVSWSSSNPEIAKVTAAAAETAQDNDTETTPETPPTTVNGKTVEITALKEGTAVITASYGDSKATVQVTVLPEDTDNKEVYDLSGDLWVSGFERESDDLVYTGQKITQSFQVYHNETLLKEKTDYTLSYKNNVNAATWDSAKAPSVTINMKGQYSGSRTLYFTILPKNISEIDSNPANANDSEWANSPGYEQVVNFARKLSIPAPALTYNKKKLSVNKDFTVDYTTAPADGLCKMPDNVKDGTKYDPAKIYAYTVNGKGNYTGSLTMRLVVLNKNQNFNTASITLNAKKYTYHGTSLTKSDVTITRLKIGKTELDPSLYDYDVITVYDDTNNNHLLQRAYINVYPTPKGIEEGYHGFKQINLKLEADRVINKNTLIVENWVEKIPFSQKTLNDEGGIYQKNVSLKFVTNTETQATDPLVEGTDYTIKYSNTKKAGKVTVTFIGKGRYKGSLKKTYQITTNTENSHFTYRWKNVTKDESGKLTISYQKNGAIPDFVLLDQDQNVLKIKTDYKVSYKNNKIPRDAVTNEMTLTVTGVGNYKGYRQEIPITVTQADIGKATLTVTDKPFSTKKNAWWKSAVTITDVNGKKLAAKTDYVKDPVYNYDGMESGKSPETGTVVTVTVTGCGSYHGTITGSYKIFDGTKNISKLQVVIDPQEYTGKAITLKPTDIHIYANKTDKKNKIELKDKESCYKIVGYQNNIKSGTAKVTLCGIGDYGGTKTYSFKIQKKVYVKNSVKSISMAKTHKISLLDKQPEKRTLTATITPKDSTQPLTNPTVIWTTSNSNIATVEAIPTTDENSDVTNPVTVSALITAKKQGTVTIKAITQDGNKTAACTVTITFPTLTQKGQTLEGKAGDTRQLTFDPQPESLEGFTFTSSNNNIASVDGNGLITMHKLGLATITVSITNTDIEQKCYVVVDGQIDPTDDRVLTYKQEAGCDDDTKAINDQLQIWENNISRYDYLYIPAGEYHINPAANPGFTAGIILRDGQSLIMDPDAKLYAKPTNSTNYRIIYVFNRSNVYISGGQLIGNKGTGEAGHGIEIVGCTNAYIRGVDVSNCHGDGIYLSRSNGVYNNGVTITGCNLHNNKRSNLSITESKNVTIENCDFNYAGGLSPECGINIEPNHGQTCSNIKISNSRFKGNKGQTIQILGQVNAHVKGVTIENCKGDKKPLQWSGFGGSVKGVTEKNNNWNWK